MSARGQAMVEMALGTLVFITVLMFGIHFAEVGYLNQKAQMASATAIWDASGKRVTKLAPQPSAAPFAALFSGNQAVAASANRRYQDFDAVQTLSNRGITQVFTRATPPNVTCEPVKGARRKPADAVEQRIRFAPSPTASSVYFDTGGMTCSASLTLNGIRIPRSFLDGAAGSGPFKQQHYQAFPITMCDVGRAKNGRCPAEHAVLLGDWALSNRRTAENGDCVIGGCNNPGYHDAVQRMYPAGLGAGATSFATTWAGGAPASGSEFWMSYAGEERAYVQPDLGGHPTGGSYNTGGTASFTDGQRCFLGITGNGCN